MGDAAELMIDGTLCELCGAFLDGDSPGHPRQCDGCKHGVGEHASYGDYKRESDYQSRLKRKGRPDAYRRS